MLPSEELLAKYRNTKPDASEPGPESPVVSTENKETDAPKAEMSNEQPATASENVDHKEETKPNTVNQGTTSESGKDDRTRYQRDWEKRLKRQEKSHQAQMDELRKQNEELRKQLGIDSKPELKPEDFPTREKYDEYKENRLRESVKNDVIAEQKKQREEEEAFAEQSRMAKEKLERSFKTPEAISDFQERLEDWSEEEAEYLDTDEGKLFQEYIDSSKVGLIMTDLLIKNPTVMAEFKKYSKDMLLHNLEKFESGLIEKAKALAAEASKKVQPAQNAAQPQTKPTMPSTGAVGKTTAASGTFNAKDWLRKNRPERYNR